MMCSAMTRTDLLFLVVRARDDVQRFDAHLVEVAVHDAGHEEAGVTHELEEAHVVTAVERRVHLHYEADHRRVT